MFDSVIKRTTVFFIKVFDIWLENGSYETRVQFTWNVRGKAIEMSRNDIRRAVLLPNLLCFKTIKCWADFIDLTFLLLNFNSM